MRKQDNVAGIIVGLAIIGIVLGIALSALAAVFLMFGLALVHHDFAAVPALGFISSFGALIVVSAIAWAAKGVDIGEKK